MFRLIRNLITPYRWTLAIVFVAMLIETAMSLAGPWPLKIVLDNVVGGHHLPAWLDGLVKHAAGGAGKMQIAAMAAIGFVAIAAISGIASYVDNYYTESVGQWVAHDLRLRAYHHLQRLSLRYYEEHQIGIILSTLTTDIASIQSFASSGTLSMLVDLFTIIGMLGLMFWLNFDFALVAIAVMPFLLLFVFRFKKAIKKATKEVRKNQSQIVTVAQQGLEAERVVKAFGTQTLEERRLQEVSWATVQSSLKARQVKSLLSPVVSLITAACVALVLWRGAGLILRGVMTVGVLTIFLAYLNKFFKPVQDLAKMTNTIAQTAVGVERIRAILEADDVIPERSGAYEPKSLRGEIAFDRVEFGYAKDAPVLRGVSFSIPKGQMVGIVGPTGSGKSTVVSLIPRFYDTTAGTVTIDGNDIRDYTIAGLRQHIGFVLQDTILFHGTVADNIAYGKPDATREEVERAAELANARRVHRAHAARLRHHGGRSRPDSLRRPAAAHRHRARHHTEYPDPHTRRTDGGARYRIRRPRRRGPGAAHEGPHRHHDRPPFEHHSRRPPDHRFEGRCGGRERHSRVPAVARRSLRRALPETVRALACRNLSFAKEAHVTLSDRFAR